MVWASAVGRGRSRVGPKLLGPWGPVGSLKPLRGSPIPFWVLALSARHWCGCAGLSGWRVHPSRRALVLWSAQSRVPLLLGPFRAPGTQVPKPPRCSPGAANRTTSSSRLRAKLVDRWSLCNTINLWWCFRLDKGKRRRIRTTGAKSVSSRVAGYVYQCISHRVTGVYFTRKRSSQVEV